MIGAKIANLPRGGDRKSENFKVENSTLTQEDVGKMLNVSRESIIAAKKIREGAIPEGA